MALTPYGAVLQSNTPSAMEVQSYYDQQDDKLQSQRRKDLEGLLKEQEETKKRYDAAIQPLSKYIPNTGYLDAAPDRAINEMLLNAREQASEMIKKGVGDAEVKRFVDEKIRGMAGYENQWKNSLKNIDDALSSVSTTSGLPKDQLRNLMVAETLFVDENGKKRLRQPEEFGNLGNLLSTVLEKHSDKINVSNPQQSFKLPEEVYSAEHKGIRGPDGIISNAVISGKYNPQFQSISISGDKRAFVTTKKEPLKNQLGDELTNPITGEKAMVLPADNYITLLQDPVRRIEIEKRTKKLKEEYSKKNDIDVMMAAGKNVAENYGAKVLQMPINKRFNITRDAQKSVKDGMATPDDEVFRQIAATQVFEKYNPPTELNYNRVRDPLTIVRTEGGSRSGSGSSASKSVLDSSVIDEYSDVAMGKTVGKDVTDMFRGVVIGKDEEGKARQAESVYFNPIKKTFSVDGGKEIPMNKLMVDIKTLNANNDMEIFKLFSNYNSSSAEQKKKEGLIKAGVKGFLNLFGVSNSSNSKESGTIKGSEVPKGASVTEKNGSYYYNGKKII